MTALLSPTSFHNGNRTSRYEPSDSGMGHVCCSIMTAMIASHRYILVATLASGALVGAGCGSGEPKPTATATPTPAAAPAPPPPPAVRVFVTNEGSGDLTVIDAATHAV